MDASIIVVTRNAGQNFANLLQCLFFQNFQGTYEVIIIDSGSTDNTLDVARSFPAKITEIRPGEFHHGRTRNLGAELASGRILVYITQDAMPLNDSWLQKLTDDFNEPKVAMSIGRQIPWQTTKPPEKFFYFYFFPDFRIVVNRNDSDYYRDNMFISNVNSAIKKDVWQQFKFSEKVPLGEDKEFAKRVLAEGWDIIYQPEAVVYHAHNYTISSLLQRGVKGGISLRQGVAGLPQSHGTLLKKTLDYFGAEYRYLKDNGYLRCLPYCIIYEITRYTGSFFGKRGLVRSSGGS